MKRFAVLLTVWALGLAGVLTSVVFLPAASASAAVLASAPRLSAAAAPCTPPSGDISTLFHPLPTLRANPGGTLLTAGKTLDMAMRGRGGLPTSGVDAVVVNIEVYRPTASGYISVTPGCTTSGTASQEFRAGVTISNQVTVRLSALGQMRLRLSAGSATVFVDVAGYYSTAASGDRFHAIATTRANPGGTVVAAGKPLHLSLAGHGIPAGATVDAAAVTVEVYAPTLAGYVRVTPDLADSQTALQEFNARQSISNLATVKLVGGKIQIKVSAGSARVFVDVNGYYSVPSVTTGDRFHPVTTARVNVGGTAVPSTGDLHQQVTGFAGVPSGATGIVGVVEVYAPTVAGYVRTTPDSVVSQTATQVFVATQTISNAVAVGLSSAGKIQQHMSAGRATLFVDVAGYFGPDAGTPGTISGFVTDAGGTHHGLANVIVGVIRDNPQSDFWEATTGADGSYTVTGLPAGTDYIVMFTAAGAIGGSSDTTGYLTQAWQNKTDQIPDMVTVTSGATTTGIDAAMIAGGAVSGTVTDAGGTHHGLAGVSVQVLSPSSMFGMGEATTAADGTWSVLGLTAGTDYQVCFSSSAATGGSSDAQGYVDQCFDNQPVDAPTPVIVTAGLTTRINAALAGGGAISGTVTDAAGAHLGLVNVSVNVWSQTGAGGYATTSADGSYTVTGLPAGTDYVVCFTGRDATGGSSAPGYIDQCYDHQPTGDTANPVAVTAGTTTTGINAALAGGGAISGTVTDALGTHHGLADVGVDVTSSSTGEFAGYTTTAADGSYTLKGLPAGTDYQVCFHDYGATGGSSESGYLDQCYLNQPDSSSATPVVVTLGTTRTGINAALAHNP